MTTIWLLVLLLFADLLIPVIVLSWLVGYFRAETPSVGRIFAAVLLMMLNAVGLLAFLAYAFPENDSVVTLGLSLLLLGSSIALDAFIIAAILKLRISRSIAVCLLYFVALSLLGVGQKFLIRTSIQTFITTGLAMAPTIVGEHRTGKCPHCGGMLFVRAIDPKYQGMVDDDWQNAAICRDCRKCSIAKNPSKKSQRPDRIISTTFLKAERWDLVTYEPPGGVGGKQIWVGRVVGLPGEKIWVGEGTLFVNGEKLPLPDSMKGTTYQDDMPNSMTPIRFAIKESAILLGADEFCILGDFSSNTVDSRSFGPVSPTSIKGVVTVCYWPPKRWRIWR